MSEHYEVQVEDVDAGTEYEEFASEQLARRAFRREADKLRPGQRVTLTRVMLLDAEEGPLH